MRSEDRLRHMSLQSEANVFNTKQGYTLHNKACMRKLCIQYETYAYKVNKREYKSKNVIQCETRRYKAKEEHVMRIKGL